MQTTISTLKIPKDVIKDICFVKEELIKNFPHEIKKIILFGSYATNRYQPDSDIDIAVVLKEFPPKDKRRLYKNVVDMEREIDLLFCTEEQLLSNEYVFAHVNNSGVAIYEQL